MSSAIYLDNFLLNRGAGMGKSELDPRVIELIRLITLMRKEKNFNYEQLAQKAGVHRTTISLMERHKFNPTVQICLRIADALEISLADVLIQAETSIQKNKKAVKNKFIH
jgi:putative transcriptional regulator